MDKIKYLEKALDDIARGMVPPGEMPSLDQGKYHFRAEMWSWSQKRARQGLAFCDMCKGEGSIDTPYSGSDPSCPDWGKEKEVNKLSKRIERCKPQSSRSSSS